MGGGGVRGLKVIDDADADADAVLVLVLVAVVVVVAIAVAVVVFYVVVVKRREDKKREEKRREGKRREEKSKSSKKLRQSHPETTVHRGRETSTSDQAQAKNRNETKRPTRLNMYKG